MYTILYTDFFEKKAKKLVEKNSRIKEKLSKSLKLLKKNPAYPSLNTHKVIDTHGNIVFSSTVSGDIRVVWNFDKENIKIIELKNIGGHSGKNRVY